MKASDTLEARQASKLLVETEAKETGPRGWKVLLCAMWAHRPTLCDAVEAFASLASVLVEPGCVAPRVAVLASRRMSGNLTRHTRRIVSHIAML